MLKILQVRLQHYQNWELPDVQAGFRKGKGTRDQIANISWIIEKARELKKKSRKKSISALLTVLKTLTVWITTNCGKFLKRWEYHTTLPVSWEICTQVKKQQLEPDMEQHTGSKLGKEYFKAVYYPTYLTYMQSTSCKMLSWVKNKLKSRFQGKISITSDKQLTSPLWQQKGTEERLDEGERGEWKTGFKLKIQKTKIMASSPITSW